MHSMADLFGLLGIQVLQRDWLSANNIVFAGPTGHDGAVVDTGYVSHAPHTVALVEHALGDRPLGRILNTHLHSDHCGGNAALQARWPEAQAYVPCGNFEEAQHWDESRLTFDATGQRCDRFQVHGVLTPGEAVTLGGRPWQVMATGGHDPDAVVLFEPEHRVLISGDALWRNRVGVIFPELDGQDGFGPALQTVDALAALDAAVVIPGHGAPFAGEDVGDALRLARERLAAHRRNPAGHARHAMRVMVVYHLMEVREQGHAALLAWLESMPLLAQSKVPSLLGLPPAQLARDTLDGLLADGAVRLDNGLVRWPA